ncbi:MAG: TVP38/TMEM64 family protein, partial [Gammaproteobacteria bacterium]|nr:TVP38/TMEM64 family protein [Gammaproteobacteria bacterium]
MKTRRIAIVIALVVLVSTFYHSGLHTYLDFAYLKESHTRLTNLVGDYPQVSMLVYFVVYILVAALSIPGALILTLAAGLLFGFWWGVLLVSFASTIGATLAMLVARYLLRSMVERKFRSQLLRVNKGVEANGRYYLFTLRLIPVFPFFAVNLIMALTRMRALDFYLVSQ